MKTRERRSSRETSALEPPGFGKPESNALSVGAHTIPEQKGFVQMRLLIVDCRVLIGLRIGFADWIADWRAYRGGQSPVTGETLTTRSSGRTREPSGPMRVVPIADGVVGAAPGAAGTSEPTICTRRPSHADISAPLSL